MAERIKLTERSVEALLVEDKERIVWDAELRGFGIRIFPPGTRKFVVQYRNLWRATAPHGAGQLPYSKRRQSEKRRRARYWCRSSTAKTRPP